MNALFDTNILVDQLHGVEAASEELDRYHDVAVSRIVWIEFLVGARTPAVEVQRKELLSKFNLLEVDAEVGSEAILIRQRTHLKLPDALILATARVHGLLLVTRNFRDFPRREPDIRIPY